MSAARHLHLVDAPFTRADCANEPRPCRRTACRFHLLVEFEVKTPGLSPSWLLGARVHPAARSAATLDEALARLPESCALDVVDTNPDGLSLDEMGAILGVTKERARQIEVATLAKLASNAAFVREVRGE